MKDTKRNVILMQLSSKTSPQVWDTLQYEYYYLEATSCVYFNLLLCDITSITTKIEKEEKYPPHLYPFIHRTLSCLAHWAPFLAKVDYLPELVFPFVKVFKSNPLLSFEVAATVICK